MSNSRYKLGPKINYQGVMHLEYLIKRRNESFIYLIEKSMLFYLEDVLSGVRDFDILEESLGNASVLFGLERTIFNRYIFSMNILRFHFISAIPVEP